MRDSFKKAKNWSQSKTQDPIRVAKRHHFSASIVSQKDTTIIWKHLSTFTKNDNSSSNTLPDEIKNDNETYSNAGDIASKLNKYFASVCDHFGSHSDLVERYK